MTKLSALHSLCLLVVGLSNSASFACQDLFSIPTKVDRDLATLDIERVYGERIERGRELGRLNGIAESMLDTAAETEDLAIRYSLMNRSAELYVESGDLKNGFSIVDRMGKVFETPCAEHKNSLCELALSFRPPSTGYFELGCACLLVAEEAKEGSSRELLHSTLKIAKIAARRARSPWLSKQVQKVESEWNATEKILSELRSELVLAKRSDSKSLIAELRGYELAILGRWDSAISHFNESTDSPLKDAAECELGLLADDVDVARSWFTAAISLEGWKRELLLHRALELFEQSLPNLTGFQLELCEANIGDIYDLLSERSMRSHAEEVLDEGYYLDWKNKTWRNDIKSQVPRTRHSDFVELEFDLTGYEHKLIVFPEKSPTDRSMLLTLSVVRGQVHIGLRPSDLHPSGAQVMCEFEVDQEYTIELFVEKGLAKCLVNGWPTPVRQDRDNIGVFALVPSKQSRFRVHSIEFRSR